MNSTIEKININKELEFYEIIFEYVTKIQDDLENFIQHFKDEEEFALAECELNFISKEFEITDTAIPKLTTELKKKIHGKNLYIEESIYNQVMNLILLLNNTTEHAYFTLEQNAEAVLKPNEKELRIAVKKYHDYITKKCKEKVNKLS